MILPALSKLISIAVLTVLAVGALKLFGLNQESLGLAGITAAVTATAGQSFLKQFLASLFMSSPESPVQVGEIVSVGGYLGSVTKVMTAPHQALATVGGALLLLFLAGRQR